MPQTMKEKRMGAIDVELIEAVIEAVKETIAYEKSKTVKKNIANLMAHIAQTSRACA
jgi:hypothetical protein